MRPEEKERCCQHYGRTDTNGEPKGLFVLHILYSVPTEALIDNSRRSRTVLDIFDLPLQANTLHRADFGKGMTDSKEYLMCGASQVAVGSVELRPLMRILQRPWNRAYQWARNSPLRKPGARALNRLRALLASE